MRSCTIFFLRLSRLLYSSSPSVPKLGGYLYLYSKHNAEVLFLKSIIYLCFIDINKWHQFVYILKKTVKGYQYGYQMKGLDLGVKNMWFVYRFSCLFTFYEYKQTNVNKSQFSEFNAKA